MPCMQSMEIVEISWNFICYSIDFLLINHYSVKKVVFFFKKLAAVLLLRNY